MLGVVSGLDRVRLGLDRVRAAVGEIDPVFLDTPALSCAPLGRALGCSVTLKVETLNPVRSFKGRGTETVAALARGHGASRVVCASAGNLGQALAYSGRHRGLQVTVVAARTANPLKLRQIAAFGAELRLDGEDIEDARQLAREIAQASIWSRTAWIWRRARAPPRSGSSSSGTIRGSMSCSLPSAAERWRAVSATPCGRWPSMWR
jgi:threonine dehydratase